MHRRFLSSSLTLLVAAFSLSLLASGCSAGDESAAGGSGASNSGSGGSGNGNGTGSGGLDFGSGGSDGKFCSEEEIIFVPRTPTVFVLVDQSGSIYDLQQWIPLREAVLPVIQELQADVRLGFGAYTGTAASCTGVNDLGTIAINNYDAIAAFYNALPVTPTGGQETPTALAIQQASQILRDDSEATGAKAILWVTADDDSDFCDNPDPACGNDAAIAAMQVAAAAGVNTFPLVLDSATSSPFSNPSWLDFWAQAGQGEAPNWDTAISGHVKNCSNPLLTTLRTENGKAAGETAGRYSTEGGTAKAFVNAEASAIAEQLRSKISGLKSCIVDLPNVEILPGFEKMGEVYVDDALIPAEQWKTVATKPAAIEISGDACLTWKKPEVTKFFARFECKGIQIIK